VARYFLAPLGATQTQIGKVFHGTLDAPMSIQTAEVSSMRNLLESGLDVRRSAQGCMLRDHPSVHVRSRVDRGSLFGYAMPLQNLIPQIRTKCATISPEYPVRFHLLHEKISAAVRASIVGNSSKKPLSLGRKSKRWSSYPEL